MGNICFKQKNKKTDKEHLLWSFRDECCICMENPIQTAILDCGHMNCCLKCANKIARSGKSNIRKCPVCRKDLRGFATFTPNIMYIQ